MAPNSRGVGEVRVESLMRLAISDAPGTNRGFDFTRRIDRSRIHESPSLAAAGTGLITRGKRTRFDRIRVILEGRQFHGLSVTDSEHRSTDVQMRISALLDARKTRYLRLEHAPSKSAIEASKHRGTPLQMGGKTLVMKTDRLGFVVLALRGSDTVHNRAFRSHLNLRRYRFATRDELDALTGLSPGCIPPFGRPVFDMPLYVDTHLAAREEIAFTAGSHTLSFTLTTRDWLTAANPTEIFTFATKK
jgi:Ala-tRNA(Pro) deacylase